MKAMNLQVGHPATHEISTFFSEKKFTWLKMPEQVQPLNGKHQRKFFAFAFGFSRSEQGFWIKDPYPRYANKLIYRSGTGNSNTVNSKFHLIQSYCEIFFYNFLIFHILKYTVNSNFHLIRSKTLPKNDFELTVPDL